MHSSNRVRTLGKSALRLAVGCVAGVAVISTAAAGAADGGGGRLVGSPYWNPSSAVPAGGVDMPVGMGPVGMGPVGMVPVGMVMDQLVLDDGMAMPVVTGAAASNGAHLGALSGVAGGGGERTGGLTGGLTAGLTGESAAMQLTMSVPAAEAEAVRAEWTYRAYGSALRRSIDQMRADFEMSPEHQRAMADFQRAAEAYMAARDRSLASIHGSSEHRDLRYLREKLGQQLRDQHASKQPEMSRIQAVAQLRMEMLRPLRGIESEQLAGDPEVAAARQELMRAYAVVQGVRRSFAREVRDHGELLGLRQMREQARVEHLVASRFASSSASARDRALRFAAYGQRLESRRPTIVPGYGGGYVVGSKGSVGIIERRYPWIVTRD